MSNDVIRFDTALLYIPFLLIGPLQTIVALYFIWQEVSVSSVIGVTALLIFLPLQSEYTAENFIRVLKQFNFVCFVFFFLQYGWGRRRP